MFVRSPGSGNQKLRRAGSIRATRAGVGAAGLTLLIAMAAFNTGTNLLYVMLATLIASEIASIFMGLINIRRLDAKRMTPSEIHAGAEAEFEFEAVNEKRFFWSYGVALRQTFEGLREPARTYFIALRPGRRTWRNAQYAFPKRGLIAFGPLELVSSFPFGFLEFRRARPGGGEALVYPKLMPLGKALEGLGSDAGAIEMPMKGHGAGLFSIRDYAPGDPAREIHWKLSAKGTGLKVREHEREETKRTLIIFEFDASSAPSAEEEERFEEAVSLAASLARHFSVLGYEIGVWSAAGRLPIEAGPKHLKRIYRALALVQIRAFAKSAAGIPAVADCSRIRVRGGAGPAGAVRAERVGIESRAAGEVIARSALGAGGQQN